LRYFRDGGFSELEEKEFYESAPKIKAYAILADAEKASQALISASKIHRDPEKSYFLTMLNR
jgi:hypothetical protein